jgi:hypothetical protein
LTQADFGPLYTETIEGFADKFITTAAAGLMPIQTLVADVAGSQIILEAGSEVGLAPGAEFEVMRMGDVLTLSDGTKIAQTYRAARLRISRVESRISYAQVLETYGDGETKDAAADLTRIKKGMEARFVPTSASPARKR